MQITLSKPLRSNGKANEFDVRQIKKALNRLGYYQPLKATGITGMPDRGMFDALKKFQTDQGLEPTGQLRPEDETVKKLSNEASSKVSGQYIWRTVGDDKVRDSHAALEGELRDLSDSPDPGEEVNCRCWAEFVGEKVPNPVPKPNCDEEREVYEEAKEDVRELSERFNDLLLELDALSRQHSALVKNARNSIIAQAVPYILTLPFSRVGVLNELLRRYFGNIVNKEFLKAADRFMKQSWAIKQKAQDIRAQAIKVGTLLQKAAELLKDAEKKLRECEDNEEKH